MNNANIRRYARALKRSVRGFRLRDHLAAKFRRSLAPLLEDIPDPSYEDLVEAFGPPEHLAEVLLHEIDVQPLPQKAKVALPLGIIAVIFVIGFMISSVQNAPENGVTFPYTEGPIDALYEYGHLVAEETFSHSDINWMQPKGMAAYLIIVENLGSTDTVVSVQYSTHNEPNSFTISAGNTQVFFVNDPQPGEHTLSFDSPDGTLSGTVRVLLSDQPIPQAD